MVVEDDPILAEMACEMIEECGLSSYTADTGAAAYAYLESHAAEVASLFVDIGLRDSIDGIALAITTAADYPDIRICVTSGRSTARPPELPSTVRYLPKPWRALEVMDFMLFS